MKNVLIQSRIIWTAVLVVAVTLCAFIFPLFPIEWGRLPIRFGFTLIYFSAVMSMDKRKAYLLIISLAAFLLEWISGIFDLEYMIEASRALNIIFFVFVILLLIKQMASSKIVNLKVILESIGGYLLLGILFSVLVAAIMQRDPAAFNITLNETGIEDPVQNLSKSMYFGLVTLATLGYGDIVPLKPYSRSLATFISISGQLYIAVIIALLVGKFAAAQNFSGKD
jgi:voltage-gated potassium channel